MKNPKHLILITTLTLLILCTCSCSQSPQGTEKSFSGTMEEVTYPEYEGYIRDIKFGEKGELYLSMEKPNEDASRSTVSAWKREKGSKGWTRLYEKEFVSSAPSETVEVNLKFLNEGALIKEGFYGREDVTKKHANLYYFDRFEEPDLNKVFTSK